MIWNMYCEKIHILYNILIIYVYINTYNDYDSNDYGSAVGFKGI